MIEATPGRNALQLFLLGFLTLFLELVLIRYLAASIWNLGYFPNLVLLSAFIGMGMGFSLHRLVPSERSEQVFALSWVFLLLLTLFVLGFHPSIPGFASWGSQFRGELYFTDAPAVQNELLNNAVFLACFLLIMLVFALLAQRTAKMFTRFPPLHAYTLDISGSCCGIVGFMLMSWLHLPAWVWFLCLVPLAVLAVSQQSGSPKPAGLRAVIAGALILAAGVAAFQDTRLLSDPRIHDNFEVAWSPYQKLEMLNYQVQGQVHHTIFANGIFHQEMGMVSEMNKLYGLPYIDRATHPDRKPYRNVLILGAGSGNDVMGALLNGAEHVDAVEIDPVIYALGRKYHDGNPYGDPRVTVTIDDGRAFMTRTKQKYDLIIYALTDSVVKVSSRSELRLENYLFTEDSVRKAWSLLNDGGDILFYNFYRRPFILQKIEQMVRHVTGNYPRQLAHIQDFYMLLAGRDDKSDTPISGRTDEVAVPTDDWPFLYLETRGIPTSYLYALAFVTAVVVVLMVLQIRVGRGTEAEAPLPTKVAFALMGIAFLLLETKSVIQFSLLFGTTWLNNSLVFLAVLLLVLAANWTAASLPRLTLLPVYLVLMVACAVPLVYPLHSLLYIENVGFRFVAASLLTFAPIFFGNLMFSMAFRDEKVAEHLFGWNLMGATLGGLCEYTSLALGYNDLGIIVALCYTGCYLCLARRPARAPAIQDLAAVAAE